MRMINTRQLKKLALEQLPEGSALRYVILAEKDELSGEEFMAKLDIWMMLLNRECGRK